jgi:hypothetical protein
MIFVFFLSLMAYLDREAQRGVPERGHRRISFSCHVTDMNFCLREVYRGCQRASYCRIPLTPERRCPKDIDVTMSSPSPSHNPFASDSYEPWDPFEDVPSQQQTQASKLQLCQYAEWDSERSYDEDPPHYIHYSIEWKVTVNNRAIMPKDTEQDIVLAPADYFLKPKVQSFLRKKNEPLRSEDTTVVISVTTRSEQNLTKRFDDTSIEWAVIESQLVALERTVSRM